MVFGRGYTINLQCHAMLKHFDYDPSQLVFSISISVYSKTEGEELCKN